MLKIKDNVDLKELEKYGIVPKYDEDTGEVCKYEKIIYDDNDYHYFRRIIRFIKKFDNRKLVFRKNNKDIFRLDEVVFCDSFGFNKYKNACDFDLLYDLIQAGLVEKVGK